MLWVEMTQRRAGLIFARLLLTPTVHPRRDHLSPKIVVFKTAPPGEPG